MHSPKVCSRPLLQVLVMADAAANVVHVAADLLSQVQGMGWGIEGQGGRPTLCTWQQSELLWEERGVRRGRGAGQSPHDPQHPLCPAIQPAFVPNSPPPPYSSALLLSPPSLLSGAALQPISPPCSQAEHGPDSQVVLVALPGVDLSAVQAEVERQCDALPRNDTARKALAHSYVVRVPSVAEAIKFSNM